ncbi:hypothetical protein SAE01_40880 [Segetibacter aerophilus]|uniref:Uncharacterized protein n=1 Tax=Segetibacter aerophilus TaxID=670293 RepID=A0A512BI03_9BACT|nr:hypothetical protein SAE01_40880 [Segetibacter aerophilus]
MQKRREVTGEIIQEVTGIMFKVTEAAIVEFIEMIMEVNIGPTQIIIIGRRLL